MFLGVAVVASAIAFAADAAGILTSQELSTVDVRFAIRGGHGVPNDIVLVPIDDVTFNDLDVRWPFPRHFHAEVIDSLRKAGAKVIAYDVQFTEQTDARNDNALINAVGRAGNLVLAATEVDKQGHTKVLGGEELLRQLHAVAGNALLPTDTGGVNRRMPYEVAKLKTFSVTAAERESGKTIKPSDLGGKTAWIDYVGPPGTFKGISFSRVIKGKFPRDFFRGKIAVVGPVAPSLQDVHPTSVGGGDLMSGAEIQANAIWTALHGFPLKNVPGGINELLVILLALVAPLASLRLSPFRAFAVAVATGALYAVVVQFAFNQGKVVAFVYPMIALAVSTVGCVALSSVLEAFERERIRDLFGRFVPEQVVDEVLARTSDGLHLGGDRRRAPRLHDDVHRPSRVHDVLGVEARRRGDPHPQLLLRRDVAGRARPRRDARLVSRRRHDVGVRRPARTGRPRRSCDRVGTRDPARTPAARERVDPRAGLRRGLPHGRRPEQRLDHVRQHRL